MRRLTTLSLWVLVPLGLSMVAVFAVFAVLLATQKRENLEAPDYRVARIGGLEYEAMLGRPIHPANAVDAAITRGQRDRRLAPGEILFGAFISVTNPTRSAVPAADDIALRDDAGHVYKALPAPAGNAYAYSPRVIPPSTRIPHIGTPADDNLAAGGLMLLFRVPAWQYENGSFELVIHDPLHPAATVSLMI
jgi:hypothetical protein